MRSCQIRRRLLLHREADALAPCFEADSRFAALQLAPYRFCTLLSRHLFQKLYVGSGPIIRLFTASHVLNSNGLGKRTILTLLDPQCLTKKNKYRLLSAIGIQIGVNFGVAKALLVNKTRVGRSPIWLEIHEIGDQRCPAGLVAGTTSASAIRVKVFVK